MHSTSQRNRFTKKNRLPDSTAYERAFRSGSKGVHGDFRWFAIANGMDEARLGIAIPKRHVKTATHRNRLKRLVRESFRLYQSLLTGLDVVLVVRRQVDLTRRDIAPDLRGVWPKVRDSLNSRINKAGC